MEINMKIKGSLVFKILSTLEIIFDFFMQRSNKKEVERKKVKDNEDKN